MCLFGSQFGGRRSHHVDSNRPNMIADKPTPNSETTPKLSSGGFGADFGRKFPRAAKTPVPNCPGLRPAQFGTVLGLSAVHLLPNSTPNRPEDNF